MFDHAHACHLSFVVRMLCAWVQEGWLQQGWIAARVLSTGPLCLVRSCTCIRSFYTATLKVCDSMPRSRSLPLVLQHKNCHCNIPHNNIVITTHTHGNTIFNSHKKLVAHVGQNTPWSILEQYPPKISTTTTTNNKWYPTTRGTIINAHASGSSSSTHTHLDH